MSKSAFLWAIATACIWGAVPILEKIGLSRVNPSVGLLVRCLGVAIGAVILFVFKFNMVKTEISGIAQQAWFFLIAGGLLASVVGQMCFYRALKDGAASRVVPIAGMYPLVSFLLALIFLGERCTFVKFSGMCCIVLGVILLK